jgi:hypothetical protein
MRKQPGPLRPGCATMTAPLLILMVLIVAFAIEVRWLCRC